MDYLVIRSQYCLSLPSTLSSIKRNFTELESTFDALSISFIWLYVVVVVRPSLSTMTNDITGLNKTWCDESCCG